MTKSVREAAERRRTDRWGHLRPDKFRLELLLPHFNDGNMKALASVFGQFAKEKTPGLFSHELRFHNSLFGLRHFAFHGGAQIADAVVETGHLQMFGVFVRGAERLEGLSVVAFRVQNFRLDNVELFGQARVAARSGHRVK